MAYRDEILKRLKERDRFSGQFSRIVESYASISDSLNYVLSRQKLGGGSINELSEDTKLLKEELGDLYKKKALNDQQLIEAHSKINELEKRLSVLVEQNGEQDHDLKETKEELGKKQKEIEDLQASNELLNDEILTLHIQNKCLNDKFVEADQERVCYIDVIKKLKEKEAEYINEFNESETKKRLQRLRSDLDDAAKPAERQGSQRKQSESSTGTGRKESVVAFDTLPTRLSHKLEVDFTGEVNDCAWNSSGSQFYTVGSDKFVRIFEPQPNAPPRSKTKFSVSTKAINRIDLHPDNSFILTACNDNTVYMHSTEDQRRRASFTGHSDKVTSARFLSQTNRIVSGSTDRTLRVWDANTSGCVRTFMPGSMCSDVVVHDMKIISSHWDKMIRFWDGRAETPMHRLPLEGKITSLNLSMDGNYLLVCCRNETLSLIDLRTYVEVHVYSSEAYRTSYEYCKCAISPGQGYVSAGSSDGHIFIWNLHSTKLEKTLQGHETTPIYSLAWNPHDSTLLSTDKRKYACLYT